MPAAACVSADFAPEQVLTLLDSLSQRLIWVAPVGLTNLLGFMVCHRVTNNPDRPSSRIEFLARKQGSLPVWKKKFHEQRSLFSTFPEAIAAAFQSLPQPQ